MGKQHPGVDAYIAKAAPFARPILERLRRAVHAACPEVEETLKWSSPHFDYKGPLCGMAAFKSHATFGIWKGALLGDGRSLGKSREKAWGNFGRLASLADLPSERALIAMIRKAAVLNDRGIKVPRRVKPKPALRAPASMMAALRKNPKALATFEGFPPSHRREYVEWVVEAKGEDTRARRIETAVTWIAEGKIRNWKYVRK